MKSPHSALAPASAAGFAALLLAFAALPLEGQTAPPNNGATGAQSDETVKLSQFDVTSTRDVGYGARDAMSATRMAVPLDQTPTTVVVLDQEFLKDLSALDATSALAFVSGMNNASTQYTGQIAIRGFNQAGVTYRDGLPQNTAVNGSQFLEMASIERLEVIKGPEGVLYGSEAGGGVVNAATKKPLATPMTDVTFYVGSWDTFRGTVDTTGPIDKNGNLLFRLIVDEQDGNTQIRGGDNSLQYINPQLKFRLGPASDLSVNFSYGHFFKDASTNPWFAAGGQLSTFLDVRGNFDESDELSSHWEYLFTAGFEHSFGDHWHLRLVYRENQVDENKPGYAKTGYSFINAAGQTIGTVVSGGGSISGTSTITFSTPGWVDILANRQRKDDIDYEYDFGPYLDLAGNFNVGPAKNTVLFSMAYEDTIISTFESLASYPSTSVFNPIHYTNPLAVEGVPAAPNINNETSTPDASVGLVDNISFFSDKLIFSLGERRDSVDSYAFNRSTHKATALRTSGADGVSYKAGVVYRPVPGLALFYDYADTFTPVSGSTYEGNPYKPETGATNEGGAKLDLFGGRLTGTVSYFQIKQTNVPETVVVDPVLGTLGAEQQGFIKVKGTELDIAAKPIPEVTLLAAYGNLDSVTDKGVPQRNVPIGGNFKTLGKYSFSRTNWLHGLSVGAGYIHNARRSGDTAGSFFLPAYESYNAFIIYQTGRWRYQINGENLKNSSLAGASSVSNIYVYPGRPRNFISSVEYKF